jgi:GntR family transcriptional regulator
MQPVPFRLFSVYHLGMSAVEEEQVLERLQLRYRRVQQALAEEIARGRSGPGSLLPPERALAEHFGVSRVTLRRALAELERAGVVTRAGSRWAVAGSPIGEPPNALMSFSEMAATRGLAATATVLGVGVRPATLDEADTLGLAPGAALFELERLRAMDGVPILIDRSSLPAALVPGLEEVDFTTSSLYDVVEARFGIRPTRARFTVEAVAADERRAALLDLEPGRPLLRCRQLTEDQAGRPVESCEMHYRGDRYRFRATLLRSGTSGWDVPDGLAPLGAG